MLQWVSKLLAGVSVDLPAGVPASWVALAEKELAALDKIKGPPGRAGLARDALNYVLHGEPLGVLSEVSQGHGAVNVFRDYGRNKDSALKELYAPFDALPGPVILRWGLLLDAVFNASGRKYSFVFPAGFHWPETLIAHATGRLIGYWGPSQSVPKGLSCAAIERALVAAEQPASVFVTASFASPVGAGHYGRGLLDFCRIVPGFGDAIARHLDAIRPLLLPAAVAQRLHVIDLLLKADRATLEKIVDALTELATSSSKQVRIAAEPLLRHVLTKAIEPLRTLAREAKPDQRVAALRLLHDAARAGEDETLRAEVRELAQADKAPSVQALVAEWDGSAAPVPEGEWVEYTYEVPTITWRCASSQLDAALAALWDDIHRAIDVANKDGREAEARARANAARYQFRWKDIPQPGAGEERRLRDYLAANDPRLPGKPLDLRTGGRQPLQVLLQRFAQADGVEPAALIKTFAFFVPVTEELSRCPLPVVVNAMAGAKGRPSLLELQKLLEPFGVKREGVFKAYCNNWARLGEHLADAAVWPFFADNLELLLSHLNPTTHARDYAFNRDALFRAIGSLPRPPEQVINALFELALGTQKTERPRAQAALANLPNKEARIVSALADGKSEVRAVAAAWLTRLQYAAAVPALEAALKTEKNDLAKGVLLDALESFGHPVEKYLDRATLAADARKAVAKEPPKDLAWVPWSALPRVRWADNGEEVPPEVLRGLVLQAFKHKSPEPNALLRKYCAMMEPRDREAFGQFVLEGWLREDVRPIPADEALARARAQAQQSHAWALQYPQYAQSYPHANKSVDEITAALLPVMQRLPAGSAAGSKGVLAIASACCAEHAAAPVARYLKEYYGTRAAQGKALIAMLAWIEHPTATQLMLSIGSRFRTRSFQDEATRQAEALAERKGWTLAELADRTIPSAGFDESCELDLSFGARAFTARLLPDFKIELYNPDGKKIASLPEPRQDDDAELAKESKKALSTAKKEIKNIVDLQTDRLYEALCTGRDWSFADWQLYLQQHPIMRRLVQRLVWGEVEDGRITRTFRPLDDGTLTDTDDNEVTLVSAARVRLAHDSSVATDVSAAWQAHLVDYEIAPLFQQFGKGGYTLPDGKKDAEDIDDFKGHLLEAFALRGRASKLGYTRGGAEDGGVFYVYEKRYPTLGVTAVIEFTGNSLPEENRTVALQSLYFTRAGGDSWQRAKVRLADVPKVLVSESYHDIRTIAAEGTGFDPEWDKKASF